MVRKDPQIERLGDVLDKSLRRLELASRLDEYGIWPVWNDVVGKSIAFNAQPEKIRNGTLFVRVASPVWMQQLQYMKEMIAEKLNRRLKSEVVKNIFFVVGRVRGETVLNESKSPPPEHSESPRPNIDEQFLDSIEDPEIKQAFRKLLKSYSRRKRTE
jgi:predicted nucleic acid-binding Zn ribbon protein